MIPGTNDVGNEATYPNVARLMRKLLAMQSTKCECLFPKAGDVTTKKHNRIDSHKVDEIIFLVENFTA